MPLIDSNLYSIVTTDDYLIGPTNLVLAPNSGDSKYIGWHEIRQAEVKDAVLNLRFNFNTGGLIRVVGASEHLERIAAVHRIMVSARDLALQNATLPTVDNGVVDATFNSLHDMISAYRAKWMD